MFFTHDLISSVSSPATAIPSALLPRRCSGPQHLKEEPQVCIAMDIGSVGAQRPASGADLADIFQTRSCSQDRALSSSSWYLSIAYRCGSLVHHCRPSVNSSNFIAKQFVGAGRGLLFRHCHFLLCQSRFVSSLKPDFAVFKAVPRWPRRGRSASECSSDLTTNF